MGEINLFKFIDIFLTIFDDNHLAILIYTNKGKSTLMGDDGGEIFLFLQTALLYRLFARHLVELQCY